MDNEQVYGKKVVEYTLAQAVADGRAADYRIVVPTLTYIGLRRRLNLPAPGTPSRPEPPPGRRQRTVRCAPPPCMWLSCAP
ncbi:hypothetical protein [Streptomyces sp. NPDC094468]|uniref:hypothetical protein n=1 Tax=Streptomyces sp. NPDC094468 TaxID=3366066 RepID=UPI0037FC0BB5